MKPVRPSSSSPQALNVNRAADFQPESQWTDEPTSTILTIKLPGFNKEQLKISFDESSRNLRVQGERRGLTNSSKFSREFKIPEKCKLNEMQAKFVQNTHLLTITMPKELITAAPSRPVQKPSRPPPPPPPSPAPAPPKNDVEETSPSYLTDPLGHINKSSPPPLPPQDTYPLPTPASKPKAADADTDANASNNNSIGKQNVQQSPAAAAASYQPPLPPPPGSRSSSSTSPKSQKDVADQHPPTNKFTAPDTRTRRDNEEEAIRRAAAAPSESLEAAVGGSLLEKTGAAAAVGKRRAVLRGLDEERRLLVNAGVAVLVIAALGFYVSYKFGKTTKD